MDGISGEWGTAEERGERWCGTVARKEESRVEYIDPVYDAENLILQDLLAC